MVKKLDSAQHGWLKSEESWTLMKILSPDKKSILARYVGGCVRDALLGYPVKDIDIATELKPEQVEALAQKHGIKVLPTGRKHGTLTLVVGKKTFQVTSLRRDLKTDGRHAEIAYTRDWEQDAKRRDFTLNAIYADRKGKLYNPCHGIEDALKRDVRFIGSADQRIEEDYLRILRFFRFSAKYGRTGLNREGLAACARFKDHLTRLSAERIWQEFKKILELNTSYFTFKSMQATGVLAVILPECDDLQPFSWLLCYDQDKNIFSNPILRLYSLVYTYQRGLTLSMIKTLSERFKLSNQHTRLLSTYHRMFSDLRRGLTLTKCDFWLYKAERDQLYDVLHLLVALAETPEKQNIVKTLYEQVKARKQPRFPVKAEDLRHEGIKAGKEMGVLLRKLEKSWITSGFKADKNMLMGSIKQTD